MFKFWNQTLSQAHHLMRHHYYFPNTSCMNLFYYQSLTSWAKILDSFPQLFLALFPLYMWKLHQNSLLADVSEILIIVQCVATKSHPLNQRFTCHRLASGIVGFLLECLYPRQMYETIVKICHFFNGKFTKYCWPDFEALFFDVIAKFVDFTKNCNITSINLMFKKCIFFQPQNEKV